MLYSSKFVRRAWVRIPSLSLLVAIELIMTYRDQGLFTKFLIQQSWGGAHKFAFLTRSQVMLTLLVRDLLGAPLPYLVFDNFLFLFLWVYLLLYSFDFLVLETIFYTVLFSMMLDFPSMLSIFLYSCNGIYNYNSLKNLPMTPGLNSPIAWVTF